MIDAWTRPSTRPRRPPDAAADAAEVLAAAADAAIGRRRAPPNRSSPGRDAPATSASGRPVIATPGAVHGAVPAGRGRNGSRGRWGVRWRHQARSASSSSRTPRASRPGLVELSRADGAHGGVVAAGGTDDGRIGTSFDLVTAGIAARRTRGGRGGALRPRVCDPHRGDRHRLPRRRGACPRALVDAPLVEGGVAAAVAAEAGDDLDQVVAAAESARDGGTAIDTAAAPDARGSVMPRTSAAASIRYTRGS